MNHIDASGKITFPISFSTLLLFATASEADPWGWNNIAVVWAAETFYNQASTQYHPSKSDMYLRAIGINNGGSLTNFSAGWLYQVFIIGY